MSNDHSERYGNANNGNGTGDPVYGGTATQYPAPSYEPTTGYATPTAQDYYEQPPKVVRDYANEQNQRAAQRWGEQSNTFEFEVREELERIAKMLIEKNKSYGDSALNPLRVFSQADAIEAILVRMDDKLSRIRNGKDYPGDDDTFDLIGYLVLYRLKMYEKLRQAQ